MHFCNTVMYVGFLEHRFPTFLEAGTPFIKEVTFATPCFIKSEVTQTVGISIVVSPFLNYCTQ